MPTPKIFWVSELNSYPWMQASILNTYVKNSSVDLPSCLVSLQASEYHLYRRPWHKAPKAIWQQEK